MWKVRSPGCSMPRPHIKVVSFLIPEDLSDDNCYLPEASQWNKGGVECVYEINLAGENRVSVTDGLSHGPA